MNFKHITACFVAGLALFRLAPAISANPPSFIIYPPVNSTDARASFSIVPGDYKVKNVRIGSESSHDSEQTEGAVKGASGTQSVGVTQTREHFDKQVEEVIRFGKGNHELSTKAVMGAQSSFMAELRRLFDGKGSVIPFEQFDQPPAEEDKRHRDLYPDEEKQRKILRAKLERDAVVKGIAYGIQLEILSCATTSEAFETYGQKFRDLRTSLAVGARVFDLKTGNVVAATVQRVQKSKRLDSLDVGDPAPPWEEFLDEVTAKCAAKLEAQLRLRILEK